MSSIECPFCESEVELTSELETLNHVNEVWIQCYHCYEDFALCNMEKDWVDEEVIGNDPTKEQPKKSYEDLKKDSSVYVTYRDLLGTVEWATFREQILSRDQHRCIICFKKKGDIGKSKVHLEVHHKYYIHNKLPWAYKLESLETLCNECHEEYHRNNKILVYGESKNGLTAIDAKTCQRCLGVGILFEYLHVENGVCFGCDGIGYIIE